MSLRNSVAAAAVSLLSRGAAQECSPGRKPEGGVFFEMQPRRGERGSLESVALPVLLLQLPRNPGLTPGAIFCCRFAAVRGGE
jgi:hypothetical protein